MNQSPPAELDQTLRDRLLTHFPVNRRSTVANWFLEPIRDMNAVTPLLVVTLVIGQLRKRLTSRWCVGEIRADIEQAIETIESHRSEALDCARYYLAYASLPEDERQRVKQRRQAERPPTDRQIAYLQALGYTGAAPATLQAASEAIDRMLAARRRGAER